MLIQGPLIYIFRWRILMLTLRTVILGLIITANCVLERRMVRVALEMRPRYAVITACCQQLVLRGGEASELHPPFSDDLPEERQRYKGEVSDDEEGSTRPSKRRRFDSTASAAENAVAADNR